MSDQAADSDPCEPPPKPPANMALNPGRNRRATAANPFNRFLQTHRGVAASPPAAESRDEKPAPPKADQAPPAPPPEIDFDNPPPSTDGYDRFRQEREQWRRNESKKHGLPLGKQVEVDLGLGRNAKGLLFIDETSQLLDPDSSDPLLRVGTRRFHLSEVESMLRLEDPGDS